ncbi:hypothetical protein K493DRAFT_364437 [Basidiobolus meristosporus CBS 931.73]|uniref:MRN complex-interacting protein N-terminal domain-containing protein n=1 Tax=Basidiobolus meristosporus CBS 931.73 TaxID=1314790 RepID=A0A1Y1W8F3_9FUNG|nr:hypothetical protein K493DRAFT_364437 [Basidiobolus meristosporus CBS 931.73]|eukprot:ORX69820.1 hypothetical protein K493DRAFT_364437 [Basidiobolus meristosporus CBS 931.73]
MPHFQVVRCYVDTCGIFQSQQVKKAPKWQCKVCGEKQSIKRVYFDSENAKDCRQAVQQLNLKRKELDEKRGFPEFLSAEGYGSTDHSPAPRERTPENVQSQLETSKWSTYASEESEPEDSYEPGFTTDMSALNTTQKRYRARNKRTRDNKSINEAHSRKQPAGSASYKKGASGKEYLVPEGNGKTSDAHNHDFNERSKWLSYENEPAQYDSPSNKDPISKPKDTTSKSSKWSAYMEEEDEEEEEENEVETNTLATYSHPPLAVPSNPYNPSPDYDCSVTNSGVTMDPPSPSNQQDSPVDIQQCTISTKTRTRLSRFAFTTSKATKGSTSRALREELDTTGQTPQAPSTMYNKSDKARENDVDALEIDEVDPFDV